MANGYSIKAKGENAEIFIYEDIGDSFFGGVSAKQFAADLKKVGNVKSIDLRINSFGGDVFDGLAIYRNLVEHPARVTARVDGIAASIASVIAMAGSEILVAESGRMMIHNASGVAMGNAATMRELADVLDTISASLADVYVARTGQKAVDVAGWMAAETWFDSAKAVELGFATGIMPNMRLAAKFDGAKHKFTNMPAELLAAPVPASTPIGRPALDAAAARLHRMKATLTLRA